MTLSPPARYDQPFLNDKITQGYGATNFASEPAGHGVLHWHNGVDYAAPVGTPIYAFAPGVITVNNDPSGYGLNATVKYADGSSSLFGHLSRVFYRSGETVGPSASIALSGSSGNSTGPHVHLATFNAAGEDVNPLEWLKTRGENIAKSGNAGMSVEPLPASDPHSIPSVVKSGTGLDLANPLGLPPYLQHPDWRYFAIAIAGFLLLAVGLFSVANGPRITQVAVKAATGE